MNRSLEWYESRVDLARRDLATAKALEESGVPGRSRESLIQDIEQAHKALCERLSEAFKARARHG